MSTSESSGVQSTGVTAAVLTTLDQDRIVKIEADRPPAADGSAATYTVTMKSDNRQSVDG